MEINAITQSEISSAAAIIQAVFGNHGDKAAAEFLRFQKGGASYICLFGQERRKGCGCGRLSRDLFSFDVHAICWVAVLPEHRRQGICAALISHTEEFIKTELLKGKKGTLILTADITNYYERLGYVKQESPVHDGSFIMSKIVNG